MKTIAICNPAAGTGKTSVAVQLAASIATHSDEGVPPTRALLIDLGRCADATQWLVHGSEPIVGGGSGRVLEDGRIDLALVHDVQVYEGRLGLLHADSRLVATERNLASRNGGDAMLLTALARLDETLDNPWDFALIDCPGNLGPITQNALMAADFVVVPVPEWSVRSGGLDPVIEMVDKIRARFGGQTKLAGLLPFAVETPRFWKGICEDLADHGIPLLDCVISASDAALDYPEGGFTVHTVPDFDPCLTREYTELWVDLIINHRPLMPCGFIEALADFAAKIVEAHGSVAAWQERRGTLN